MTSATTIDSKTAATTPEQLVAPDCMARAATFNPFTPISLNPLFELTRWELQARILADQPAEEIAMAMDLPIGMVTAFEADYFNVRQSLQHSSIVVHTIIGIPPTEEWSASDLGKFWMWVGFAYGVAAIELTIPPFKSLSPKMQALGLLAYLHPKCDACDELRLLVAGKVTPVAATITIPGRKLFRRLDRATRRRVRPVDLLTSLSGLICRPPQQEAIRDEELQAAPFYLKESA